MEEPVRILLVDDDEEDFFIFRERIRSLPRRSGEKRFELAWASGVEDARQAIQEGRFDVLFVDYRLGGVSGLEFIAESVRQGCKIPLILLTGQGNYEVDLAAMQVGAADYLVKDQIDGALLERAIRYALERKKTQDELELRIRERTQELIQASENLANANWVLHREIERREQSETELRKTQAELEERVMERTAALEVARRQAEVQAEEINAVFQNLAEAVSVYDAQSRLLRVNRTAVEMYGVDPTGLERAEVLKRFAFSYPDGSPVEPETSPIGRALRGETVIGVRNLITGTHGREIQIEVSASPILTGGRISGAVAISHDISERERLIAALEGERARLKAAIEAESRRVQELSALRMATAAMLSTLDFKTLVGKILHAAHSSIPAAEYGFLYLQSPEDGERRLCAAASFGEPDHLEIYFDISDPDPIIAPQAGRPDPLAGLGIIESDKPILLAAGEGGLHPGLHSGWHPWPLPTVQPARAWVAAPLLLEGENTGTLLLAATRQAFTQEDLDLLEGFAGAIAIAIQNARLHAEVQRLSMTDPLTELYNRRGMFVLARHEFEQGRRFGRPFSAILIDIDHFKRVNDTHGHPVGDEVLQGLARRFRESVRSIDILARYGGEEFAVLLPESDLERAVEVAERLRVLAAAEAFQTQAGPITVTVSAGAAEIDPDRQTLEILLECADAALYRAKQAGRNRVEAAGIGERG